MARPDRVQALRSRARHLFSVACAAADPGSALFRALRTTPLPLPDPGGRLVAVAVGKAAVPMYQALHASGAAIAEAIVVTNYENARPVHGATVHAAGHPVPDVNGARAAEAVETLLQRTTEADRVVALISGGASALLPAPLAGVPLEDKATTSRLLLAAGLDIAQVNLVRQSLSRLKGGGFLRAAAPAPVTAYILSDVIGDDLRVIASGLTTAPIGTRAEARAMLERRGLWAALPASVQAALHRLEPAGMVPAATNVLIGSNRKSLEAVLAAAGPTAAIVSDALTGDVGEAARTIVAAARDAGPTRCLIFGGETVVTLRGGGSGGRNQELALRVAMAMPDLGRDWVFLSGATDGRDGPTDAAGGIVDAGTVARIGHLGGDPAAFLAENDSYRALSMAGDLLVTGATGTNVTDVQLLLLGAAPQATDRDR